MAYSGFQHIGVNAFGKYHTLRVAAGGVVELAGQFALVTHQLTQLPAVGCLLYTSNANQALVGRVAYDYKSKYLIEFAFRYEGSSKFPANSRWGLIDSNSDAGRNDDGFSSNSRHCLLPLSYHT